MVTMVTGKLQVLKYLIVEVGADPVARDNDGLTTLHAATQGGHLDVVRVSLSILHLYNPYIRTYIRIYIHTHPHAHTHGVGNMMIFLSQIFTNALPTYHFVVLYKQPLNLR